MQKVLLTLSIVVVSWVPTHAVSNDASLDVALSFLEAMERMDFDAGLEFVSEDVEYINSPGTTVHGHGGIRGVLEPFFAPIDKNEFIVERTASTENTVFIQRLDRHRIPQGWFELPVTAVMEVNEGKITYWREYFDVDTIRSAMEKLMRSE